MELKQQSEYYDTLWEGSQKFGSYKLKRVIEILKLLDFAKKHKKNPKILDLGCGDGRCCQIWHEIGDTKGIDLSQESMKIAEKRFPFIEFTSGDATNTNYKDKSFDIIISQEVIEHIETQTTYIDECKRLLSKNGILILTTPNKFYFDRRIGGNYSDQPIENILYPKELKKLLSKDFEILKFYSFLHPKGDKGIYRLINSKFIHYGFALFKANALKDYILSRSNLGLHLITVAKKTT
jgi:ubiquinone/menaquinone biosynthesis C-methylase UbiE